MAALAAAASLALLALALPSASASSELTGSRYHPVPDAAHRHLVGPFELDAAVDCAMRNLTYAFVNALLSLNLGSAALLLPAQPLGFGLAGFRCGLLNGHGLQADHDLPELVLQ